MSLEAAIAENTAAIKEMCVLLKEANEGRAHAVEAIKGAAAEGKTGTRGRPAGSKDKAKEDPAPAEDAKPTAPAAKTSYTVEEFRIEAGKFLDVTEPTKTERKAFLKSINEHLGVAKIVEASADDFPRIVGWFEAFARGEKVNFSEGEDDAVVEDEDDGIG